MAPTKAQPVRAESGAAAKPAPGKLKSMTGYAQAHVAEGGWSLRITIRSVNHRFLDLHLRVPEGFEAIEPRIRQIVRDRVRRGHLDVGLRYDLAGPAAIGVNREVAAAYVQAINDLRKTFSVQAEPDLAAVLRMPGVVGPPAASVEEDLTKFELLAAQCLNDALDKLDHMREREAEALRREMIGRLSSITLFAARVQKLAEAARPAFARRLEQRLKELLGDWQIDSARLAQEAALAAERSDVSEELTRLASHVAQFEGLLDGGADVGKKLDFLLQEMQREGNTLLSKTPGNQEGGIEITTLGLEIKSEIEKLREQVQNIE